MIRNFLKTFTIVLTLFLSVICQAFAQQLQAEYKFYTYSPEGGFYYDGVKSNKQDKSGFIWILMDNDLFRFDGYQYVSYNQYFQSLDSSTKWIFNYLETDTLGHLYVVANGKLTATSVLSFQGMLSFRRSEATEKTNNRTLCG